MAKSIKLGNDVYLDASSITLDAIGTLAYKKIQIGVAPEQPTFDFTTDYAGYWLLFVDTAATSYQYVAICSVPTQSNFVIGLIDLLKGSSVSVSVSGRTLTWGNNTRLMGVKLCNM